MATKFSFAAAALAALGTLGVGTSANAQNVTDVLVRDGAGNTIANNVRSFDENEAGSGLVVGYTPEVGSSFTTLYQANVVGFNDAAGQTIIPMAGLNGSFASGGYEFTVAASIRSVVTSVTVVGGITTATFESTGGSASIFYDSAVSGGVKAVTSTGAGFDDGTLVGRFDVVGGAGLSTFTTFADGTGLGATRYDFVISPSTNVDADYISGLRGPIGDVHFTSSQVDPPGTSLTSGFHLGTPDNAPDLYATTAVGNSLLTKVDGSNVFTTAIPEPGTYALMLAGLGAIGFVVGRRRIA